MALFPDQRAARTVQCGPVPPLPEAAQRVPLSASKDLNIAKCLPDPRIFWYGTPEKHLLYFGQPAAAFQYPPGGKSAYPVPDYNSSVPDAGPPQNKLLAVPVSKDICPLCPPLCKYLFPFCHPFPWKIHAFQFCTQKCVYLYLNSSKI